ncbi:MAG: hypothetical protein LBI27_02240 [Clostridiales bacterium]|jgi:hypothetical protein|nr:hypothetical protein [Clostridiales bacterium]
MNEEVSLSWKFPTNAPDTVYIAPIYTLGNSRKVNMPESSEHSLRNVPKGLSFRHNAKSSYDVTRREFLVYMMQSGSGIPDVDKMIDNPEFTVTVTVGSAAVFYDVKTVRAENDLFKHVITVKSQFSLEPGILGYSFNCAGRRFTAPFPGAINRGKHKYPPFFTQADADIAIQVANGTNADINAIYKKMSIFG